LSYASANISYTANPVFGQANFRKKTEAQFINYFMEGVKIFFEGME